MTKGEQTRTAILSRALDLATLRGLEGLTFGILAKQARLSKSGLYAHFESKEHLQCGVLDAAAARFVDVVLAPALKRPRGLPRIEHLFDRWLDWGRTEFSGGCPFVSAAADLDDRPGTVRDCLVAHLQDLFGTISRAARIAVEEGHFDESLDTGQFAYEFWGIIVSDQHYLRLLGAADSDERAHKAFRGLVQRASAQQGN
jgi:AcrR family transcriptional regulator